MEARYDRATFNVPRTLISRERQRVVWKQFRAQGVIERNDSAYGRPGPQSNLECIIGTSAEPYFAQFFVIS
jgi:hypothetical protein